MKSDDWTELFQTIFKDAGTYKIDLEEAKKAWSIGLFHVLANKGAQYHREEMNKSDIPASMRI